MTDAETAVYLRRLRFPADLERAFQEDYYQRIRTPMRISLIVGIIVLVVLGIRDYLMDGPLSLILSGYGLFIGAFTLGFVGLSSHQPRWNWQLACLLLFCACLPFSDHIIGLAILKDRNMAGATTSLYALSSALLSMMIACVTVMRVQWRWATVMLLAICVVGYGTAVLTLHTSLAQASNHFSAFVIPCLLVLSLAAYLQERQSRATFLANHLLEIERARSEALLLNILPESIAERLKTQPGIIADSFAEVSVLFADIVNFTPLSARLSASEVVSLLNDIFSAFDALAEKHGLEKIKTIGDSYMAVGGVPEPSDDHARAMADMALEMQTVIAAFQRDNGEALQLRIGIHTGPVVAGVIGAKKFSYDLWGDTVNVASRMESHGGAGLIQVTEATYRRLQGAYIFGEARQVDVKGRGLMPAYPLLGCKSITPPSAPPVTP